MDYTEYAKYCRLVGYRVEETPHGIWIGLRSGFFNRVPACETTPPSEAELRTLFRRHPTLGVHYGAIPGSRGKASHNFFVRNPDYDLKDLQKKARQYVRRGLENCRVRRIGFDELHRLGLPLNLDTLARQRRDDPILSDPDRWTRLCRAGEQVGGAQVWGAFVCDELAAYVVLFQVNEMVNALYQMSRTNLIKLHPNPALTFTVTQTVMRTPGIEAVYNGPGGLWSNEGLDRFKQHMGFEKEPVVFVVRLRPLVERILLKWGGRRVITALGHWRSDSDLYRRIQSVLDTAAMSS